MGAKKKALLAMETLRVRQFRLWSKAGEGGKWWKFRDYNRDVIDDSQRQWSPELQQQRENGSTVRYGGQSQLEKQFSALGNEAQTNPEGAEKMQ